MGMKRHARECALQILYPLDILGKSLADEEALESSIARFFDNFDAFAAAMNQSGAKGGQ